MIASQVDSGFLRYLLTHDCQPGTRLPSFDEISAEMGISTGKLREQFEVARMLGLVEASPRKGIRCLSYNFLPAVRLSLMVALSLDRDAFRAFAALRIHLETAFWDEAVLGLTQEDIARLHELVTRAQAKLNDERIQIPYPEHRLFHLTIFSRLENPFVLGLLEAYWDAYEAVELNTYADYSYLQEVWSYHAHVVDALETGDYAAGREWLIQHMRLIDRMGVAHELSMPISTKQPQGAVL
jgi:DNA-binding FadR family transcriptional regulator